MSTADALCEYEQLVAEAVERVAQAEELFAAVATPVRRPDKNGQNRGSCSERVCSRCGITSTDKRRVRLRHGVLVCDHAGQCLARVGTVVAKPSEAQRDKSHPGSAPDAARFAALQQRVVRRGMMDSHGLLERLSEARRSA